MKVLLINKYLYPKGGDAIYTLGTGELLEKKSHKVIFWGMQHPQNLDYPYRDKFVSHIDYNGSNGVLRNVNAAVKILYSFEAKKKIEEVILREKPDLVHLNNFAHQISPSILHPIKKHKIPVVATLHDYKLVCASYLLLNEGKICEKCKGGKYFNCFFTSCVKNSKVKSLLNTIEMYLHHDILKIYDLIDKIIAPSKFMKNKIQEMGFEKEIYFLPNFINVNSFDPQFEWNEKSMVYFGRLSDEKGLFTLINAFKNRKNIALKIIGDGPLRSQLSDYVESENLSHIKFFGYLTGKFLRNEIKKSMAVILPSECYENNPLSIGESFALGKPVIGSNLGGIPELVINNKTGLVFNARDPNDLRAKIDFLEAHPAKILKMGKYAREYVEKELNSEKFFERILKIYQAAIDGKNNVNVD